MGPQASAGEPAETGRQKCRGILNNLSDSGEEPGAKHQHQADKHLNDAQIFGAVQSPFYTVGAFLCQNETSTKRVDQ